MAHGNNDQEGEQVHMSLLNSEEPDSEDVFQHQMQKRYEEEKEVQDFVKKHGTSSSEEDMNEKQRSKE